MQKHTRAITFTITSACLFTAFISGLYVGKKEVPFVGKKKIDWSIGIYVGTSPYNFFPPRHVNNPVLTAKHVFDVPARFVADPFMIQNNKKWNMFFEVMNKNTNQGDIGLAISDDGFIWNYHQIVLDEPFHLSYPYVFRWRNEYYMIPETYQTNSIRLYKAFDFPKKWSWVGTLVEGRPFADSSIIRFKNTWYLFTSIPSSNFLYLYWANELEGPWLEHPNSPIIKKDKNIARPAGRVITYYTKVMRYAQDDYPTYGNQVRAFEISILTPKSYKESEVKENPILKPTGKGWNGKGMHHIDAHHLKEDKWIACVDGYGESIVFGLYY